MHGTFARTAALGRPVAGRLALSVALGFLAIASTISLAATSAYLISRAALTTDSASLAVAITSVRLFAILRGATRYAERLVSHSAAFGLLTHVRTWFYAAVEPLAPARLSEFHTGDLLSRVIADVEVLETFFVRVLLPPLVGSMAAVFAVALLASFRWELGLALCAGLVAAGVLAPALEWRAARGAATDLVSARARLDELLLESIEGLPDLLAFDAEGRHHARVTGASRALAAAERRLALVRGAGLGLGALLSWGTALAILAIAIRMVAAGELDGVYLALVVLVAIAAFEAVQGLPQAWQQLPLALASARRTFQLLDAAPAVADGGVARLAAAPRSVAVERVAFSYPNDALVWRDLTLTLSSGKCVAITGESGAGKSTIVSLLLRFWEYGAGAVAIGGEDARGIEPDVLRARFSVVPQDIHLFHATIRGNLLLADGAATDAEMRRACRVACFDDVLNGLPQGLDTITGEGAAALSGGERQRLAIARAVLKDAPILVLDEPTANLDPASEARLVERLAPYIKAKATLLITHHPALVALADEVYRCEDGRLLPLLEPDGPVANPPQASVRSEVETRVLG